MRMTDMSVVRDVKCQTAEVREKLRDVLRH